MRFDRFFNIAALQKSLDSLQVKRYCISGIKIISYEVPQKLPKKLRLWKLGNIRRRSWDPICKSKTFIIAVETHKTDIKFLCYCQILPDFITRLDLAYPTKMRGFLEVMFSEPTGKIHEI